MPTKALHFCNRPGCDVLVSGRFCDEHAKEEQRRYDRQRGTAHERGYTSRWQKYSKWFLKQPENVFCKLQLHGCTGIAQCVDHIDPPNGPDDPMFWRPDNHQPACIHCNSVKGRRKMVGKGNPYDALKGKIW